MPNFQLYHSQVTGETTWDRPESEPKQITNEEHSYNDSYNRQDSQDSQDDIMGEGELPPDWVALEDVDSGDVYYANEVRLRFLLH